MTIQDWKKILQLIYETSQQGYITGKQVKEKFNLTDKEGSTFLIEAIMNSPIGSFKTSEYDVENDTKFYLNDDTKDVIYCIIIKRLEDKMAMREENNETDKTMRTAVGSALFVTTGNPLMLLGEILTD